MRRDTTLKENYVAYMVHLLAYKIYVYWYITRDKFV